MTQRHLTAREGEEIWATTTEGTCWYVVTDSRGHDLIKSVGGKEGTRFRITSVDREINQDNVINIENDPFANGYLKRLDADQNEDERTITDQALTTEDLMALFAKTGNAFHSAVKKLNERNVRRLRSMAVEVDASTSQTAFLDEHILEHYKIEGSMPSYDEMTTDGFIAQQ